MTTSGTRGRPGFVYDDIADAAARIVARGERPTLKNVHAELGGGSMSTIQRHLADWRASHRRTETQSVSVPAELQRIFFAEVERMTTAVRSALEAELADVQADRDTLGEINQRQDAALVEARGQEEKHAAEIERQAGMIAALERALTETQAQVTREREAAELARREAAQAAVRLEGLPELQRELKELRERAHRAEIAAAELRGAQAKKG